MINCSTFLRKFKRSMHEHLLILAIIYLCGFVDAVGKVTRFTIRNIDQSLQGFLYSINCFPSCKINATMLLGRKRKYLNFLLTLICIWTNYLELFLEPCTWTIRRASPDSSFSAIFDGSFPVRLASSSRTR